MSVRDHSLDEKIVRAATADFLELGFQGASMRQIAKRAGLTTGALYTRYQNKDVLFASLVESALRDVAEAYEPLKSAYLEAEQSRNPEQIMNAIREEERISLELMFTHYDQCVLFFCCSDGSSIQRRLSLMMEEKASRTVQFLRTIAKEDTDLDGMELILSQQFNYYRHVLEKGYPQEKAIRCMKNVEKFMEAGWKDLFGRIL